MTDISSQLGFVDEKREARKEVAMTLKRNIFSSKPKAPLLEAPSSDSFAGDNKEGQLRTLIQNRLKDE